MIENNIVEVKNSPNYKTSWNFSKFIDIYNIITDLDTRDGILIIFNHSLIAALHKTPPMLFSVETKKKYYKTILDCLWIDFPTLPFFKYFEWIYAVCAHRK